MKKILFFYLTLFCLTLLLVSCSTKTASNIKTHEINAKHFYNNNILSGEIKIPSKYDKQKIDINILLTMSEEDKKITDIILENKGDVYSFSRKLPKEGRWNIKYTLTYKGQTLIKKYTDVFGQIKTDIDEIETLKIETNPNPIIQKKDFKIQVSLINKEGNLLKNCEVILQIERKDINYVNSLNMSNENGLYIIRTTLPKNGRYRLTTHINYSNGHKMETVDLLVGNNK